MIHPRICELQTRITSAPEVLRHGDWEIGMLIGILSGPAPVIMIERLK